MDNRSNRSEALLLINRIRSRYLSFAQFSNSQQFYDVVRRPYSTLPSDTLTTLRREINEILTNVDTALANLSPETFQSVLDLKPIKASPFGGQALVRRFLRGNGLTSDYLTLSNSLAELRATLTLLDESI